MTVKKYTPLHNHTHFSLLDGFSTPEDYLERCRELGITSFAVSEHGNMYSFPYFDKLKDKYPEIKVLYGVELYEIDDMTSKNPDRRYWHLIAIAKNERGRRALNKIVTVSNFEGMYYKPRISIDRMVEFADDLIVCSACLGSKIAKKTDYIKCVEYVDEYKSIFTHFYLEMQSHRHEDQEEYNQKILQLSKDTNTPFVITTDSHASTEEDLEYQGYHVQIAQDRETMGEIYEGCYLQDIETIHEIMDGQIGRENVVKGLLETNNISDLCDDVRMPFQDPKLPHFPLPSKFKTNKEYLRYLCLKGWEKRKIDNMTHDEVVERQRRLDYELSVIGEMDFDGYFLILWDALNYIREKGVEIGDGRGSGAGSFVCYLLQITNLDPIKYGLIFERFLNPERVGMPDIDLDLDSRDVLIKYVTEKYGEDRVCQILNFSYLTPVVALKDVASKILKIPYSKTSEISKRFAYSTFDECMYNNPNIYEEYPDEIYHRLFDITGKISGKVRHSSIHAGGVGIVDGDMYDYMGMQVGTDGERVIQVDKRVIEDIGIVKYDFLGVKTLRIVKNARRDAGLTKWDLDINNPKLENDKGSYDLISSGNTNLVFQMESQGMKDLAKRAKPQTLEELSAVIALYRPDSMPYIGDYLRGKANADDIEYIHKDMKSILKKTYGALIYQEQILEIVRKFGGRTYGKSDLFRRAIGKKNMEEVRAEATKLRQEVVDNGYSEDIAEKLSDMLLVMGNYSFNKSHAMAYASLCLQTAYLKKHYPVEFFKASLNEVDKSQLSGYILDARANNVQIIPPNINKSEKGFSIHDGKIMFGLQSIKGLGESVANTIINEREENGLFKNFNDFIKRVNPSESLVVTLVKAGAIPTKDKKEFLIKYGQSDMIVKPFNYKEVKSLPTLKVLKEQWGIDTDLYNNKELRLIEYNKKKKVIEKEKHRERNSKILDNFKNKHFKDVDLWEYETLSVFVGDNPFVDIYKNVGMKEFSELEDGMSAIIVGAIVEIQKKKDRNKNQFAYISVYTAWGIQEIVCWASQYSRFQNLIKKDAKIAVLCSKKDDQAFVHTIKSYEQWKSERLSE